MDVVKARTEALEARMEKLNAELREIEAEKQELHDELAMRYADAQAVADAEALLASIDPARRGVVIRAMSAGIGGDGRTADRSN